MSVRDVMPQCGVFTKFKIGKEFHAKNRKAVSEMIEHGGNCSLNFGELTVNGSQHTTGGYNYISMPRGLIDWHSHPGKCKDVDTCAIGIPSPADMKNITIGSIYGTQAHLVYAREGTYMVQLQRTLVKSLRGNPCKTKTFICKTDSVLSELHNYHIKHREVRYDQYQSIWLDVVKDMGFDVTIFKDDTIPIVPLFFECGATHEEYKQMSSIEIPSKEIRDKEQRLCASCSDDSNTAMETLQPYLDKLGTKKKKLSLIHI